MAQLPSTFFKPWRSLSIGLSLSPSVVVFILFLSIYKLIYFCVPGKSPSPAMHKAQLLSSSSFLMGLFNFLKNRYGIHIALVLEGKLQLFLLLKIVNVEESMRISSPFTWQLGCIGFTATLCRGKFTKQRCASADAHKQTWTVSFPALSLMS